jgi:hypothetical protein
VIRGARLRQTPPLHFGRSWRRRPGWGFVNFKSPGGGLYYGRRAAGGVYRYKDANPYDVNGSDVQYYLSDPVDTTGWNQTLCQRNRRLSANRPHHAQEGRADGEPHQAFPSSLDLHLARTAEVVDHRWMTLRHLGLEA